MSAELAGLLHAVHLGMAYADGFGPIHPPCAYCAGVAAILAADGWIRVVKTEDGQS